MQQQVYQVHDVDELKQILIDVWHGFEQSVINVWKYEIFTRINNDQGFSRQHRTTVFDCKN